MAGINFENFDTSQYQDAVKSESSLFDYIQQWSGKTGRELLTNVLWIWYSKDALPIGAIAIAMGALGYFISPVDLIPDAIPVAGFLDDTAVLAGAIKALSSFLTPEAKIKAELKVSELLDKKHEEPLETNIDSIA